MVRDYCKLFGNNEKKKHDKQKQQFKEKLGAQGFQERNKLQSESPTVAKESFEFL